jgi:hypothetical protein
MNSCIGGDEVLHSSEIMDGLGSADEAVRALTMAGTCMMFTTPYSCRHYTARRDECDDENPSHDHIGQAPGLDVPTILPATKTSAEQHRTSTRCSQWEVGGIRTTFKIREVLDSGCCAGRRMCGGCHENAGRVGKWLGNGASSTICGVQ